MSVTAIYKQKLHSRSLAELTECTLSDKKLLRVSVDLYFYRESASLKKRDRLEKVA